MSNGIGGGVINNQLTVLKCDGTAAVVATDRFLLADAGSTVSASALGGVAAASRKLWTFANNGAGCPQELDAPAAPRCAFVAPAADGGLVLGALADGSVGWVRQTAVDAPVTRTVAASTALDPTVEQGIFITAAGTVTLNTPVAGNACLSTRVFVKRTSNDPTVVVRVTAAAGIDGAPGNSIQLGTASSFGTLTGEGAVFVWDGATWRIVAAY